MTDPTYDRPAPLFHLRIGLTAAFQGLHHQRRTAVLLGVVLFAALVALLPLTVLYGQPGDWLAFRPIVRPVWGGDWGLPWLMHLASPSAAQQEAASTLGVFLLVTLWATVAVALGTIIILGAARASHSRGDRLVQRAVGASRRMLLSAALIEMALVGICPLLLGPLVGIGARHALAVSWPGRLLAGNSSLTILTSALVTLGLAAVFLGPALITPRRIRERSMGEALPALPVVCQSAVCLIVLVTGSLLSSRAKELSSQGLAKSPGGHVFAISTGAEPAGRRSAEFQLLSRRLAKSGLHSVSLSSPGTLNGLGQTAMVLTECGQCTEGGLSMSVRLKPAIHKIVSADTFQLLGLLVLQGRGFTAEDDWSAPRVAVVSRSLAGREFQDGNPIGRRIYAGDSDTTGSVVVGVVEDRLPLGLGGSLQPRYAVYLNVLQHPPRTVDLLVRDAVDTRVITQALAATSTGGFRSYSLTSELGLYQSAIAPVQWFARRFAVQGWMLLGLASFGIIAYMCLWADSLRGEMAVRRSVGARSAQIFRLVLGRALAVAVKGVAAGAWFGIAIWSALPDVVAGALSWDPSRILEYGCLVTCLVMIGVLLPAWRLSRGRPVDLLESA
jgi:hypothetical protein